MNLADRENEMKLDYIIYVVGDSRGNKDAVVANESSDTIQICGMKNKDGESIYFESEAYHLNRWCEENSLAFTEQHKSKIV